MCSVAREHAFKVIKYIDPSLIFVLTFCQCRHVAFVTCGHKQVTLWADTGPAFVLSRSDVQLATVWTPATVLAATRREVMRVTVARGETDVALVAVYHNGPLRLASSFAPTEPVAVAACLVASVLQPILGGFQAMGAEISIS